MRRALVLLRSAWDLATYAAGAAMLAGMAYTVYLGPPVRPDEADRFETRQVRSIRAGRTLVDFTPPLGETRTGYDGMSFRVAADGSASRSLGAGQQAIARFQGDGSVPLSPCRATISVVVGFPSEEQVALLKRRISGDQEGPMLDPGAAAARQGDAAFVLAGGGAVPAAVCFNPSPRRRAGHCRAELPLQGDARVYFVYDPVACSYDHQRVSTDVLRHIKVTLPQGELRTSGTEATAGR